MNNYLNITNKEIPNNYHSFIYKTYFPNELIYIGKTKRRFHLEYFGSGSDCKDKIKEFGKENLKREILIFCKNENQLNKFEEIFIKKFDSINPKIGYNILKDSSFGLSHLSSERLELIKKKMSFSRLGKKHSKESKLRMIISNKDKRLGAKLSNEHKQIISKANKGKKLSEEHKLKISNCKSGIKLSEEHKLKISKKHLGIKKSKEHKINISKGRKGIKLSDVTKQKIREANLGCKNPRFGKKLSDEHKAKLLLTANNRKGKVAWNKGLKLSC